MQLSTSTTVGDLNPAFSPDGRLLAFSRMEAIQASDLLTLLANSILCICEKIEEQIAVL
jgi:hypothetical protein